MSTTIEGWVAYFDADRTGVWECLQCGAFYDDDGTESGPPSPDRHKELCPHYREATMKNHTPGPWAVAKSGVSVDAGRATRIRMEAGADREELKANATLIAAAPDLLASLTELVNSPNWKSNAMWDRARAAIDKATGATNE